jgi:hypothetical protein
VRLVRIGPEEGCEAVSGLRALSEREIGEQRQRLVAVERYDRAIAFEVRRSEQVQAEARHGAGSFEQHHCTTELANRDNGFR